MGMLLRRHYAVAKPVKPVEQTEAISVEEKPIEDEIQADDVTEEVAETAEEEVKEKPARKPAVKHNTGTKRKIGRNTAKRK